MLNAILMQSLRDTAVIPVGMVVCVGSSVAEEVRVVDVFGTVADHYWLWRSSTLVLALCPPSGQHLQRHVSRALPLRALNSG